MAAGIVVKIAAHIAAKAAADKESRKKILFIILFPTIMLLILVSLILYLLSTPFSMLVGWLVGDEASALKNLQIDYGYNQALGIYDKDYTDGIGQSYDGIVFTDGMTDVVYYNQLDDRWAEKPYGTDNIGGYACGPTSMAIIVLSLQDELIDPPAMALWSYENGYWCPGNGSYHSLIPGCAESFGLVCESIGLDNPQGLVDALANGNLIVALMSKGHFTTSGHFIVFAALRQMERSLSRTRPARNEVSRRGIYP